jgi:hypothetical protein
MEERRQYIRLKTPVLIEFPNPETWKTERSFTRDVSQTGASFPTSVKLQLGQELAITLGLPFHSTPFHTTGEIVWLRQIARLGSTHYEVGVRFRWIEDPDRQRLVRFFQTVLPAKV